MNAKIRAFVEQSLKFAAETCKKDGHEYEWPDHIFMSLVMGQYTELLVEALVSNMQVDGDKFYYNEFNEYGCITVKFFVECDPWKEMRGPEVEGIFGPKNEQRGTGQYRLNEKFAQYLLDSLK